MANFRIITNNPMAAAKYPAVTDCRECTVAEVFTAVRDAVHRGAVTISHPLAGSVKPNESPYKSVVVSVEKTGLDLKSLQVIEGALETLQKLAERRIPYTPGMLEDYQVIDLDLLDSAIGALPAEYHF